MRSVLTVCLSCGVLLIVVTPLGLAYLTPVEVQEGNTNPFAGAWMSSDLPKQEKEDEDQQEGGDSLLTKGTILRGRPD